MSSRTSEGIGTVNCWCCWRMGLRFDVEKRLGSGVETTHATPSLLGRPRRRIDTASRVSKSTPCVRCVQPCARRFITEPGRRRPMLSVRLPTRSCDWARRRRACPNRCRSLGLSRALSCARWSCTCGGCPRVLPGRGQRRCRPLSRCDPSRKPGSTLLRASRSGAEGSPADEWRWWDPSAAPACRSGLLVPTPRKSAHEAHRCLNDSHVRGTTAVLQSLSTRPRAARA